METQIPNLPISDFWYDLPDDRIARYPVPGRDRSKLLTCIGGKIGEDVFYRLPEYLASDTLLIGNETRVVQARLNFRKAGGALIELFCLSPGAHFSDIQLAFTASSPVEWRCLVGNKSGLKVYIIQNIDRKIPLEDLAYAKNLSMDELLNEIESIVASGTKIDISYYINDYVDEYHQEEIYDYFHEAESDSIEKALLALGESEYTEEEIRLMRIKFMSEIGN